MSTVAGLAGRLALRWELLLILAILAIGAWSARKSDVFLTRLNLLDLTTPYVYIGLMAFGLALVVIAGEIDISVASTLAVSVVSFAHVLQAGVNIWLALLAGLGVATALGCVNGFLVGVLELPSLAVTLGTLAAYRGLAFVIGGSEATTIFPLSYTKIGGGYIRNELPIALLVLTGFAVVLGVVLHATRFGRYLYAIGSSREAARFSGIPVTRVRLLAFGLSGFMAGVAGVVYVGYFGSARADSADGALLDVVTVVVLGGVDIFGGSGSMLGVFLALVLVAVLRNGMQLANLSGDTQDIAIGGLLLAAILAGNLTRAAQAGDVRARISRWRRKEVMRSEDRVVGARAQTELENPKGG
jgi:rhamnose transport system permease protein